MEPLHAPWFQFAIAVLATWRLAHLVAHEDGPFDAVVAVRRFAGSGKFGRLMDCPYCLSLWIAAPFAWYMADELVFGVMLWLAISGGACLLERAVAAREFRDGAVDIASAASEAGPASSADAASLRPGTPH